MADGGVFIDIFGRLNLASFAKVFNDVQRMARESGEKASKDFSAGTSGMFGSMTADADAAFREMQISLGQLQVAEARINAARLDNFSAMNSKMVAGRRTAVDSMIRMQGELDAAIANSQRLAEAAAAKQAEAAVVGNFRGNGYADQRSGNGSVGRTANVVGGTAALGGAAALYEGFKHSADIQQNLNSLAVLQNETAANINKISQAVFSQANETGFKPGDISKLYSAVEAMTNGQTGQPYRGQDAVDVISNALRLSRVSGGKVSPEESLQGLTTTMHDYRVGPEGSSGVSGLIAATLAQFKGSPEDFFHSLHSVEPMAMVAGIKPEEIFAALAQMSQTGQTSQQSSVNLSNILKSFSAPNSVVTKALGQLGLNPQDMSVQLSQKGLGGTLSELEQAIASKAVGPNGSVVLGAMAQNDLMKQQQTEIAGKMSPEAQKLLTDPLFQKSLVSGFQARKVLQKHASSLSPSDEPLMEAWLKDQKTLEGPSAVLKQNKPEQESLLAAFSQAFNTKDAARTAIMLGGSPQALQQYQNREQELTQQGSPEAFQADFKKSMDTAKNKLEQLSANLESITAQLGNNLLPTISRWVGDINDFLTKHGTAAKNILEGMLAVGGIWLTWKAGLGAIALVKGVAGLASGALDAASAIKNGMPNWGIVRTGTEALATAETTAAADIKGAGLGSAMKSAAGNFLSVFSVAALTALMAKQAVDMAQARDRANAPPEVKKDLDDIDSGQNPAPGWGNRIWPGRARGGIIGYDQGSGGVHDPYSQPLMGQTDTGGDSVLGLINGKPVGLRGGEGILTPQAVAAMGGPSAVDAMNSGETDPWSNPMTVGTTFFGSFAEGVAKYSPWGKFLTGPAQTLKALAEQSQQAQGMNGAGFRPSEKLLEQQMLAGMSPEQLAAAGISRTKKGGWKLADGSTISSTPGGTDGIQSWLRSSLLASGMSPDEARGILAMNRTEGGANDPMSILGFTESQASGPGGHLQAFMGQWNDPSRRGAGGAIPGVGQGGKVTDWNAYMTWIRQRIVGQNGSSSDWQGNAQPAPGAYQQGLMGNLGKDDPKSWFSRGGVIPGYAGGGVAGIFGSGGAPEAPPPAPPPAPPKPPQFDPTMGGNAPWDKAAVGSPAPKAAAAQPPMSPQNQAIASGGGAMGDAKPSLAPSPKQGEKPTMGLINPQGELPNPMDSDESRQAKDSPSRAYGQDNSSKGFGIGGGLIGAAESAASSMGGPMGGAAQPAFQLANRAIGYAGQLVGIGISGLMETFLPNNSPLADPGNNIFGKMAMGISGMHPTSSAKNLQQSAPALNPKQDLDQGAAAGQMLPQVHMPNATINNYSKDHGETTQAMTRALNQVNGGLPAGMGGYGG